MPPDLPAGEDGMAAITLRNRGLGLELEVSFRKAELPMFTQWKMMGQGEYVLGLEPANCHPDGQAAQRAAELAVDARKHVEEIGNRLLVAVDRYYERVTGRHWLHAAATASISASVSSG
jgi:hypothetical protein